MPPRPAHDSKVADRIRSAILAIEERRPRDPLLRKRAERGSLKLNFNTVQIEARVQRHLFDKPGCVYEAEHELIAGKMPKKGDPEAVPLRRQLDEVRKEKDDALKRLAQARTYAFHLLTRMHKLDLEVKRLTELVEGGSDGEPEELIGTGKVIGLPILPKKKFGRARASG